MKKLKIMQSFPEKWNEPTFLEFAYDNYGVWWRCRVVNVFIIWISIVSEFCPKLCEKGSGLSGFIAAEVINCFSRQQ